MSDACALERTWLRKLCTMRFQKQGAALMVEDGGLQGVRHLPWRNKPAAPLAAAGSHAVAQRSQKAAAERTLCSQALGSYLPPAAAAAADALAATLAGLRCSPQHARYNARCMPVKSGRCSEEVVMGSLTSAIRFLCRATLICSWLPEAPDLHACAAACWPRKSLLSRRGRSHGVRPKLRLPAP